MGRLIITGWHTRLKDRGISEMQSITKADRKSCVGREVTADFSDPASITTDRMPIFGKNRFTSRYPG